MQPQTELARLVCSLIGHAGVVSDIDVSVDNAMLATASMDGDVRVWGLKDGCPVAILRGHKDGANMVRIILVSFMTHTCCKKYCNLINNYFLNSHILSGFLVNADSISPGDLWRGRPSAHVGYPQSCSKAIWRVLFVARGDGSQHRSTGK